jgi:hypothetical protein
MLPQNANFFILWRESDRLVLFMDKVVPVARAVAAVDFGGLPGKATNIGSAEHDHFEG